jgi:hypothetical protein
MMTRYTIVVFAGDCCGPEVRGPYSVVHTRVRDKGELHVLMNFLRVPLGDG